MLHLIYIVRKGNEIVKLEDWVLNHKNSVSDFLKLYIPMDYKYLNGK